MSHGNASSTVSTGHATLARLPLAILISQHSTDSDRVLAKTLRSGGHTAIINAVAFNGTLIRSLRKLTSKSNLAIAITRCFAPGNASVDHGNVAPSMATRLDSHRHGRLFDGPAQLNARTSPRFLQTTRILRRTVITHRNSRGPHRLNQMRWTSSPARSLH